MTDTRNFGAACAPLIAAGFDPKWLLPAAPLDATLASRSKVKAGNLPKVQGLYNPSSGAWSGRHSAYDDDKPALSWGRAAEKIEAEADWPTDSIHVVGHEAVLFDVDVADAEGAELAMQALAEKLGADRVRAAPRRVRPNAPHRTSLVFAPAEPGSVPPSFTDFLRPGVNVDDDGERLEWRGARTYWVCGGSMHPSGVRFEFQDSRGRPWAPGDGPLDWKRTDLPAVTAEETWAVLERMRELVEARGWTNVAGRRERTRAATGGAGRVVPSEIDPMVPIELLEEAIAAIPNSSEYEDALAELASLRFMYGREGNSIPEPVADWVQRRLTDSSDWLAEDKWGSFDAGVAPSPGAFMKIVQERADPELADRLQGAVDKARIRAAFAAIDEDDEDDRTQAAAAPNPETGKRRWLASRVMLEASRTAVADAELPFQQPTTFAEWRMRAGAVKRSPPIIDGFVYPGIAHGLIAAPGVGKSLMTAHAAVCGTYGVDPLDGAVTAPPCHIIALFGEESDPVTYARVEAARDHHAPDATDAPDLVFNVFSNTSLELVALDEKTKRISETPTRDLLKLCDLLEVITERHRQGTSRHPVALIFDMLRNTFFGNENERWQVDAVFRVYKAIMTCVEEASGPPVGVMFTHHMTKAVARSGPSGAGFSAAGSIGIEGNSRLITEVTVEGPDLIKARVAKANDGKTGAERYWRRMPAEVDGHPVVYLQHVPKAQLGPNTFALADWVARLHRFASGKGAPVISYSKKPAKGTITVADALLQAGCHADHAKAVEAEAVRCGAFSRGRVVEKARGIDAASCLKPNPSWVAQELDEDVIEPVGMVGIA